MIYDLIIIGAGPAALTASIYASRYQIKHLLIGSRLGGTMIWASMVENYPGFTSITGADLAQKMIEQVKRLGGEIKNTGVLAIKKKENSFELKTENDEIYEAKSLIIATGTQRQKLNIPGEAEYLGKGVSYCATCLPPGEEIIANNSLIEIQNLGITHKVLTRDGTFQHINYIMAHEYEGEMIKIKTRYFTEPVSLTSNHPVLSTMIERNYYKKFFTIGKPRWKEAGDLTEKDVLLYPITTETKDIKKIRFSEILGLETRNGKVKNNQETHSSRRVIDEISVNKDFLRLAGYYLAEGCITRGGINFYFNKKETQFINDVKTLIGKLFSLKVFIKTEGKVTRICVFSKLIRDLFHILFGKCAPNKKIPHWLLFLPLRKQKEILKGLYRGDGCLREKDFCIVTTSRVLTYQTRDILLRFGIIPSITKREKSKLNRFPGEIGGRKIRFNCDKYHIEIGGANLLKISEILGVHHPLLDERKRICKHAWIKDNNLYLPIKQIERVDYKGKVYNLAVEKNNTYIAKNFIVHNCDGVFFKDKIVAVVGGSNAAVTSALHLSNLAQKVYLIYRKKPLRADPIWREKAQKNDKIEIIYETNVLEIIGDSQKVTALKLDKEYHGTNQLKVNGLFIEIGGQPGTELVKPLGIELDEDDYIKVKPDMSTNITGLFAAGDVANSFDEFRQIVTATSEGALAANSVYNFLKNKRRN